MQFDFVKLSGCRGGFELRNKIRHCKTVCIKRNLYLINYNRKRTQQTAKGNRDAGSFCSCDRGLHRYLRNFGGGGFEHPKPPSVRRWMWEMDEPQKALHRRLGEPHSRSGNFEETSFLYLKQPPYYLGPQPSNYVD
jgi:hypothetical protein